MLGLRAGWRGVVGEFMASLVWNLRNTWLMDVAYRRLRNMMYGPGWGAFHWDRKYQGLMLDLLDAFQFTSFVETGTYRGYSTELIASRHPDLKVFTTEVVPATYERSKGFLSKYPNITPLLGSSEKVVAELLSEKKVGSMPLFYLDAHWEHYWPLRDELRSIGGSGLKSVIVIDDFEVPGQPQFGYDIDGGGQQIAGERCNLQYILPALDRRQTFHAAYPKYGSKDAFPDGHGLLRGHIVIFQNMADEFEAFLRRPMAQQHYFAHGVIAPTGATA
jgi:predicted O-methyltransferase YrrM